MYNHAKLHSEVQVHKYAKPENINNVQFDKIHTHTTLKRMLFTMTRDNMWIFWGNPLFQATKHWNSENEM